MADVIDREFDQFGIHPLSYEYVRMEQSHDKQPVDTDSFIKAVVKYVQENQSNPPKLHIERTNILGAASLAVAKGDQDALITIIKGLVGPYLAAYGHDDDFVGLLDKAIETARDPALGKHDILCLLLGSRGNIYASKGQLGRALEVFMEAATIAGEIERIDLQVRALLGAAGMHTQQKQFDSANRLLERANQLIAPLYTRVLTSWGLNYAESKADFEHARDYFSEAVAVSRHFEQPIDPKFHALQNLGSAEQELRNYQTALVHHQKSLELAGGNNLLKAAALHSLGEDYSLLNDREKALEALGKARDLYEEAGYSARAKRIRDQIAMIEAQSKGD